MSCLQKEKHMVKKNHTIICWERPGPLDALETFDSSFSISSCICRRHIAGNPCTHSSISQKMHAENPNGIPRREFDGSNIPFENILGSISCFSSSQSVGPTADTDFMRKQCFGTIFPKDIWKFILLVDSCT